MLPVNGNQCLIGLLSMTDDFGDAVLPPQTLDLPVSFQAQVEGISTSANSKIINKQAGGGG